MTAPGTTPPAPTPGQPGTTPPAGTFTQADVDRIVSERLARERQTNPPAPPNLAELQEQARQFQALQASAQTDQQRAAAEALAQGTQAGRAELLPALIAAEIRAASGGTVSVEDAMKTAGWLNPAAFRSEDGAVDVAKVREAVASLPGVATQLAAPPAGQQPANQPPGGFLPPIGQGSTGGAQPDPAEEARARAHRQYGTDLGPGRSGAATIPGRTGP